MVKPLCMSQKTTVNKKKILKGKKCIDIRITILHNKVCWGFNYNIKELRMFKSVLF